MLHEVSLQVNLVSPVHSHIPIKAWHSKSRATKHFIHGVPLTHDTQTYSRSVKVQVANGAYLEINRVSTSVINTKLKSLILSNLIYTPHITKNCLYVSQSTKDNKVYFQFHSAY